MELGFFVCFLKKFYADVCGALLSGLHIQFASKFWCEWTLAEEPRGQMFTPETKQMRWNKHNNCPLFAVENLVKQI